MNQLYVYLFFFFAQSLQLSNSLQPQPTRLLCPGDFPGKNTGVGCHSLLQGIFSTQGSNPHLWHHLHCRWILYHWASLVAQGSVCLQCRRPGFDPWVGKITLRRKWQPTPVFLPGESHEWRSLMGYSPQGCKELEMTERLNFLSLYR